MTSRPTPPSLTFLLLAVGAGAFSMLQSLLNPVLPTIQADLQTTQSAVVWIVIAWLLAAAVATPIFGKVGDMVGKTRAFVWSLAAVALGSLIAALAPTIELVIIGRIVQGLGGAAFPLSFGIIRDEFSSERMPSAVGWLSAVIAVGGGVGIVLAGPVVDLLGWRWLLWLPMIVVGLTAILAGIYLPAAPQRTGGRINWLAAALLAGWLVALLTPLTLGSRWGWTAPAVLGLLALAAVLLIFWLLVELRSGNPVIDMRVMRLDGVWQANLVGFLFGATMFAVWAFLPQLVQVPAEAGYGFGATVTQAGWVMLPMLATMALAGMASGSLARVVGLRWQITGASLLIALSTVGIALLHQTLWELSIFAGLFGIGLGVAYAALTSIIIQSAPASQIGVAIGMNSNIRIIGGAFGTAIMTAIVTAEHQPSGLPAEAGFVTGFLVFGGVALLAAMAALLLPGVSRQSAAQPATAPLPAAAE